LPVTCTFYKVLKLVTFASTENSNHLTRIISDKNAVIIANIKYYSENLIIDIVQRLHIKETPYCTVLHCITLPRLYA